MAGLFRGKVVFITGASSGIGAACALEFAREGAQLALAARRLERLEGICREVNALGGEALALACDVRERASIDAAVGEALRRFGRLDVVLANAGFGVGGPVTRLDTSDFRRQFDTNVFGVFDTVFAALPHLIEQKGRLGIVGSVSGRLGTPGTAPYSASKFAVVGFAESIYYDLAPLGVSVTCINPGFVASEIRSINNTGEFVGNPDPVPRFLVVPAEKAARQMVRALYRRQAELIVTGHGKAAVFMGRHFPRTVRFAIRLATKGGGKKAAKKPR